MSRGFPTGVIIVETLAAGPRPPGLSLPMAGIGPPARRQHTFDWTQDPSGHPVGKTAAGAFVGNVLGLAAGLAVARQCIFVDEHDDIDTTCSNGGTTGVSLVAFALPVMGSALGAHLGGRTGASTGRILPGIVGASLAVLPGYIFSLSTVGDGVREMNVVGQAFLLVGTPVLTTLADRLYRRLRN